MKRPVGAELAELAELAVEPGADGDAVMEGDGDTVAPAECLGGDVFAVGTGEALGFGTGEGVGLERGVGEVTGITPTTTGAGVGAGRTLT